MLDTHQGVNLPGVPLRGPSLTPKDVADLRYGLRAGVDFVALSFVRSARDLRQRPPRDAPARAVGPARLQARALRGDRQPRGDRRRVRRRDGRPRRPRRRAAAGAGPAAPEADHPRLERPGRPGDHRDADARVDGAGRAPDAGRDLRRRERDPRRHRRGDALGRDRGGPVPRAGRRDDGADRAGGRGRHALRRSRPARAPDTLTVDRVRRAGRSPRTAGCA